MNKIDDKVYQYLPIIDKIESYDDCFILTYQNEKYFYKNISYCLENVLQYFSDIDFSDLPSYLNSSTDSFLLYFIDESLDNHKQFLGERMMILLASLHQKSCVNREMNDSKKKELYDSVFSIIDSRLKYYLSLQDQIDEFEFPSPCYYLLVKNISKFYNLLHFSLSQLDDWYQVSENEFREVYLLENVSFDNFCVTESSSYFLDYGDGKRGIPVYDIVSFFKKECSYISMNQFFQLYQEHFPFQKNEISLFYCLISIPDEITFTNHSYADTIMVRKVVDYVDSVNRFLLEEDKKNQEANQDKFKEENDDVNFSSDENED